MNITYIIFGLVAILTLWLLFTYNSLIALRNRVKEAWSQIDVQLKRRSSLIPNLLEAVKGYAKHEKTVLEEVTRARTSLMNAKNPHQAAEADNMLTGALKSLFAVAENYPNLKASENFKHLQEELSDTETKVAASRQFYNTNVLDLNNNLEQFPSRIVGQWFGFQKQEFFKASEKEQADIKVKFQFLLYSVTFISLCRLLI
ncbi:MAG: LemA family protein, partial [Candidatus Levybacteria bacterium]|nr:LemA family protein [Candidatus Levybacteria bacterium]